MLIGIFAILTIARLPKCAWLEIIEHNLKSSILFYGNFDLVFLGKDQKPKSKYILGSFPYQASFAIITCHDVEVALDILSNSLLCTVWPHILHSSWNIPREYSPHGKIYFLENISHLYPIMNWIYGVFQGNLHYLALGKAKYANFSFQDMGGKVFS